MTIQSADFAIAISASDLVAWTSDRDNDQIGNPFLVQVLNLLSITADPVELYRKYFEHQGVGRGDVFFYKSMLNGESIFAIDMYRDIHDQLDILMLGIRTKKNAPGVRIALRAFFDTAKYQVHYEEGGILNSVASLIDNNSYPKTIEQSKFLQRLVVISDN